MTSKEFKAWCESKGMLVVHVRTVKSTGCLRAYLCQSHKGGNFAELRLRTGDGWFNVSMRDGNNGDRVTYVYANVSPTAGQNLV